MFSSSVSTESVNQWNPKNLFSRFLSVGFVPLCQKKIQMLRIKQKQRGETTKEPRERR